ISGSDSTLGSMRTLRHSLAPLRVTLTMPPPALPVTSMLASSACAFCRFSCIFCACCISWAMFPRMSVLLLLYRSYRIRHQARALLHEALHLRIVVEGGFGRALALVAHALVARVQ